MHIPLKYIKSVTQLSLILLSWLFNIGYTVSFLLGIRGCLLDLFEIAGPRDLMPERLADFRWMSVKELPRYFAVLIGLFDSKAAFPKGQSSLRRVMGKIMKMWTLSGITFTIKYWSEVMRLILVFLDSKATLVKDSSTWVRTHRRRKAITNMGGLPTILPSQVKVRLMKIRIDLMNGSLRRTDLLWLKLLLTLISFFRACSPVYAVVKTTTITGEFSGTTRVLGTEEIRKALEILGWRKRSLLSQIRGKGSVINFSTKAGPNASLSVLGIGLDLVGYMHQPKLWVKYCRMAYSCGYWTVLTSFVWCSVLCLPAALVLYYYPSEIYLGRIAILEEARGKRRLIGITDWWTQILFKPLHDALYNFMGEIPSDGTKDQSAPIKLLLARCGSLKSVRGNRRLFSMDLSAATDRLPIDLQVQILNEMGFPGDLWRDILDREWLLEGKPVRYAVGQPMGAYSSFACLSVTHHVIFIISALRAGVHPSKFSYAVLGDDGATNDRKVAAQYKVIFKLLGMEINPIKGFEGTILEFAKQLWTVNGYNLSPLGAKNILLFIRNVEFLPSILYELLVKNFPLFVRQKMNHLVEVLPIGWGSEFKRRRPKPLAKSGFSSNRNYKRSAGGQTAFPLVTVESLSKLISSLFFQKRIKVDGLYKTVPREKLEVGQRDLSWVKVRLRVLMAIGPRSGLWYLPQGIYQYIAGGFFDGYWRQQFISALLEWNWVKPGTDVLMRIKKMSNLDEILSGFVKDISKAGVLAVGFFTIPMTYLPVFSDESPRYNHFQSTWIGYLVCLSPTLLNLVVEVLRTVLKSLSKLYLLLRMYSLFTLRDLSVLPIIIVFGCWVWLVGDIPGLVEGSLVCFYFVGAKWGYRFFQKLSLRIAQTKDFGWVPGYQIGSSIPTTIKKVEDKILLEDSGAFKQILRLCNSAGPVRELQKRVIASRGKLRPETKKVSKTATEKTVPKGKRTRK